LPASLLDLAANSAALEAVEMIGNAWQAAGAASVRFTQNGQHCWGFGFGQAVSIIDASAIDREGNTFSLEVAGIEESVGNRLRLRSDITLVASLAQLDSEIGKLTDRLIEQQDQLVAVSALARAVRDRRDAHEVLETLVELAATLTGAESAAAMVVTDDGQYTVEYPTVGGPALDLRDIFLYVNQINRSILLADSDPETWPPPFAVDPAFRRLVIAPIRLTGRISGLIAVFDRKPASLTIGSRQLLETVAAQAEAIIELILSAEQLRVRERIERDAELARAVQRNLIPTVAPAVPAVQVATRYRPASQLSGDLYDCVRRADGRLVIAVADVSGKGTAAALVMAAARMSVRGAAFRGSANDAASMMTRVCEDLYDDLGNMNRFMTIFLGVINPEHGQVVMANAGHSPVILASGDTPAMLLEADSPPIGVLPGFAFENRQITFAPGDILLVATDGFPEAAGPDGELFGYERMLRLVDNLREQDVEEIADALISAVDDFAGGTEQSDDQALVIVKRRAA
jgi:sigma-B regulation protein RsbU (phosphoserine phosphatase)